MKKINITEEFIKNIEERSLIDSYETLTEVEEKFGNDYDKLKNSQNPNLILIYVIPKIRIESKKNVRELCLKALENSNFGQKPKIESRFLNILGNITIENGDMLDALKYYERALEIINLKPYPYLEGRILGNIGFVYQQRRDHKKAEYFYNHALEKSNKANDIANIASITQNLGNCKFILNDFKASVKLLDESNNLLKNKNYIALKAHNLSNLGRSTFYNGEKEKGINQIKQALNNVINTKYDKTTAWILYYLIQLLLHEKNIEEVINYLEQFIPIVEKNNFKPLLMHGFKMKSQFAKMNGNFEEALEYFEKFHELRINLFNDKVYSMQKEKEKEIEKLDLSIQLTEAQKDKKSLEEKLLTKNKELTAQLLKSVNFNDNLNEIKSELDSIKAKNGSINTQSFNIIERKLKNASKISSNINWSEFESKFKEVYTDFFHTLSHRFPNLTNTEKKLCALLKLQLNSKEIAESLSVSIGSVEVYRSKLRKKLGMDFNQNIHTFLDLI